MRLEQLRYFLDVAQTQSIAKSAGKLFISPQGLSQSIGSLESECGMKLFTRSKNGMILNEKGSRFYDLAVDLCAHADAFNDEVHRIAEEKEPSEREHFNLLLPPIVMQGNTLAPLLAALEEAFPTTDFLVSETDLPHILETADELFAHGSCLALASVPDFDMARLRALDKVACESYLMLPVVIKARNDSPVASHKYITLAELAELPLVCFNEPVMESVIHHLLDEYCDPNIVLKGSTNNLLDLRPDAVTISLALLDPAPNVVVIPIADTVSVYLVQVSATAVSVKEKAVASVIRQHFENTFSAFRLEALL